MAPEQQSDRQWRRWLQYWLWLWPALSLLCFTWTFFDPSAFRKCPQNYWVNPLIGVTTAGWSWLRTFDSRYIAPALVCAAFFGLGIWLYWNMR